MQRSKSHYIIIVLTLLGFHFSEAQQVVSPEVEKPASAPMNATLLSHVETERELDFKTVETISYKLYLDSAWKQLAIYGEKAIKSGYDYYYLRVRVGVAYFQLKQYRKAITHFEKSLEFNSGDDYAMSYLYACYLYSERYEDAKWLSKSFSPALAESLKSKEFSAIDYLTVESGFKRSDSSSLYKNPFFLNIGLAHSINRRVVLLHTFNYFTQQESRFNVDQFQYYLGAAVPLKKNFKISGGAHFINVNASVKSYTTEAITHTVTGQGPNSQNGVMTETIGTIYRQIGMPKQSFNYIGALTLEKHFSLFDVSIGTTLAKFDTVQQYQANGAITIYPLKNNRISIGTNVYLHYEKSSHSNKISSHMAFAPFLKAIITSGIHLNVSYLNNLGPNITEANGSFVSNSVDYTLQRASATASFKLNSTLWIYGTYGYEQKKIITGKFKYNYQIFVAGLKIIPQFK